MNIIEYKNVDIRQEDLVVLRSVDFCVSQGEFIYLCGKVGSGKSSLLKSLYAEIPVKNGTAKVFNYDMHKLKYSDVPMLRRKIGIVFQDFKLLYDRSINDNLEFVLKATGWKDRKKMYEQIALVLETVGMSKKGYKRPHQLSGGEQQRMAIARALLNSPELIIADEPTGNLDPETSRALVELLHMICQSGTAVIMATHNINLVQQYPGRLFVCDNEMLKEEA